MVRRLLKLLRLFLLLPLWGGLSACTNRIDIASAAVPAQRGETVAIIPLTHTGTRENPGYSRPDFRIWKNELRQDALKAGISPETFDKAFQGVTPLAQVLDLDRKQPEFSQTLWTYLERSINDRRVSKGRDVMRKNADLFDRAEARYGVPRRYLAAFWGLETNYGAFMGGYPTIGALATLAHDPRRSGYFRAELLDALAILEDRLVPLDRMVGSWAGAMGNFQFMPSTFRQYGRDEDGDGIVDLWNSLPDSVFSAARYLASAGWKKDMDWGREVLVPEGFPVDLAALDIKKSLTDWSLLGLRGAGGADLPAEGSVQANLVLPAGARGPAFLVYDNFHVILTWNRSIFYALAVGLLADQIEGRAGLIARPDPDERPLSAQEVADIQKTLGRLGYNPGDADGVVGVRTREALKQFQKDQGLLPDGYPDPHALQKVREVGGKHLFPQ